MADRKKTNDDRKVCSKCKTMLKKKVDELVKEGTEPSKEQHQKRQAELDETYARDEK